MFTKKKGGFLVSKDRGQRIFRFVSLNFQYEFEDRFIEDKMFEIDYRIFQKNKIN